MVYTILITIVFIAELIIAMTILKSLIKFDKKVLQLSASLIQISPSIKDVSVLSRKISEQWVIIAEDFVDNIKKEGEDIFLKNFSKSLMSLLLVILNFKVVNKIRKSKFTRTLAKGWSLLENMV